MSCKIDIELLSDEIKQKIDKELKIKIEDTKYSFGAVRYIYPHSIIDDTIYLPFAYAYNQLKLKRPRRDNFSGINVHFKGKLHPEQIIVRKEAINTLNKTGSILLAIYPGFGKTITSIKLACDIGFKTLVIVNKIVLIKQWQQSLEKFCSSVRIQILTPKSKMEDCDFYIMNAINVPKMDVSFFSNIGLCIIDECHLIMAEILSNSMKCISPRYLIGLSATPYRVDDLDILLELYFGKNKIIRKLYRKHIAYQINTGFKPKIEMASNGRVNWGIVLDSQAKDHDRNELIIKIVKHFHERVFLILTKRVEQGRYLVKRLLEENEDVTSLIGSNQEFDLSSRILIGTTQKVSVGFDHDRLNTLLLAADVKEYYVQVLGRVFRTKDVEPIIFDLVDDNPILKNHFKTRCEVYKEHGGNIKKFSVSN